MGRPSSVNLATDPNNCGYGIQTIQPHLAELIATCFISVDAAECARDSRTAARMANACVPMAPKTCKVRTMPADRARLRAMGAKYAVVGFA